jgi:serine/threonine protein kinase
LSDENQSALIGHLDECPECRHRLEDISGDAHLWNAVGSSLKKSPPAPSPELERVTATMRSYQYETKEQIPSLSSIPESWEIDSFDFLEPAETPGLLGRLGNYEVIELLGQGGMGCVFKAYDRSLDRTVALKALLAAPAQNRRARERFRREARAAASVRSDHIVAIHAVEDTARVPFLVMEYVEGSSLHDRLAEKDALSWSEITRLGAEIAEGLQAAHRAGLVHRDIKPPNILLEKDTGRVKITDFGLARTFDEAGLTQTGYVVGTPEFMAPEQAEGEKIDHRADLFSLGTVLYNMCVGTPPFTAKTPLGVLRRTREEMPTPINRSRPDIPVGLLEVIERLMQKDPDDRFDSAGEVAQALCHIDMNRPAGAVSGRTSASAGRVSKRKFGQLAGLAVAASLMMAIALIASEVSGISRFVPAIAAAVGRASPDDGKAAPEAKEENAPTVPANTPSEEETEIAASPSVPPVVEPPKRIQIVTPDGLMRESIQLQKDQLPEIQSPHLIRKFEGHTGPVADLAISSDGKLALSGSGWPNGDRTLRLWEIATGKEIRQFELSVLPPNVEYAGPREAPRMVMSVAFTPDGKHAVAGITGGAIGLWNVDSGEWVRQFEGHTGSIYDLAVSPDGKHLLSGGRDATARLWDINTGEELLCIQSSPAWIRSVAFSPDGKRALLGGYDHKMRLWDLESVEQLSEMDHSGWVWNIEFSPDGSRAVSVAGKIVTVWDLETSNPIHRLQQPGDTTCATFSPDGRRILTGGYDMTVRLWDAVEGELIETYPGHRGWIFGVAFSPDGHKALSGGGGRYTPNRGVEPGIDFALRLWQMPEKKTIVVKPQP